MFVAQWWWRTPYPPLRKEVGKAKDQGHRNNYESHRLYVEVIVPAARPVFCLFPSTRPVHTVSDFRSIPQLLTIFLMIRVCVTLLVWCSFIKAAAGGIDTSTPRRSFGWDTSLEPIAPNYRSRRQARFSVPSDFDSRQHWPFCDSIRQIHDQGQCGSCWSFGSTTAFTDR